MLPTSANTCYSVVIDQGWRTYGTRAQNGTRKDFRGTRHSLLSYFFNFFCLISVPILCVRVRVCMYTHTCTHIWLRTHRLHMNYLCYQIILQVRHFYMHRELYEVLTGYLSLGCWPGGDWTNNWHWTNCLLFKQEVAAATVTSHFLPYRTSRGGIYWNVIIILRMKYIIINNNIAIINNFGRH